MVRIRLVPRVNDAYRESTTALRALRGRFHDPVQSAAQEDGIGSGDKESDLLREGDSLPGGRASASNHPNDRFSRHKGISVHTDPRIKTLPQRFQRRE